jgi:hypothetical protein
VQTLKWQAINTVMVLAREGAVAGAVEGTSLEHIVQAWNSSSGAANAELLQVRQPHGLLRAQSLRACGAPVPSIDRAALRCRASAVSARQSALLDLVTELTGVGPKLAVALEGVAVHMINCCMEDPAAFPLSVGEELLKLWVKTMQVCRAAFDAGPLRAERRAHRRCSRPAGCARRWKDCCRC